MTFEHKLMANNFTDSDIQAVIKLLKKKNRNRKHIELFSKKTSLVKKIST